MSLLARRLAVNVAAGGGGSAPTLIGSSVDEDWAADSPSQISLPVGSAAGHVAVLFLATTNTNKPGDAGTEVQNFDHNTNEWAACFVRTLTSTDISNGYVLYTAVDAAGSSTVAALLAVFDNISTTVTASATTNGDYNTSSIATSDGGVFLIALYQCGSGSGFTPAIDGPNDLTAIDTAADTVFPQLSEVTVAWKETDGTNSGTYSGTGGSAAATRASIVVSFAAA